MRILFFSFSILLPYLTQAQSLNIIEALGWFESAHLKWESVNSVESFNVYYSGEGIVEEKIDAHLISNYQTYYCAYIPGLKAGVYTVRVVPVVDEKESIGVSSGQIEVVAHDRTGYAFANNRIPGAYKADGKLKDNAVVVYITENNKNKVSLNVNGANSNPCVGLGAILEGFAKGKDHRPLIIRIIGQITDFEYMDKGDIVVENDNNAAGGITIEGIGNDAVADGWGIRVKNASNIEIRNIAFMNTNSDEGDDVGLQQNNEYVWVHHCDFFYGDAGTDADQAKGDGALDCKKSTFVTFSYNHFWDTGKSNLLGLSEGTTEGLYITYHHNWYDHSDSRHPRVRFYSAHVYNNYYDGNSKYGVGATLGSSVFVEANYFRNCKYPMLISMQGSDVFDESTQRNEYSKMPTFSKEDGGSIKAFNNYMIGQHRFVPYGDTVYQNSTIDFDAFVAQNSDELVSSNVISFKGGNAYNNFDTNPVAFYAYSPDAPEEAKNNVINFAGRFDGGDFKWTFNNDVDDDSYNVNYGLKNALLDYKTKLVSVQGDSINIITEPIDTLVLQGDKIHNFTLSGTNSTFYTISGSLSDSKGTVNYAGLSLTQCLKIESSTSILFSITKEATITLVFNADFTGTIKLNDIKYTVSAGILSLTIPVGEYTITKGDSANLYYISVIENTTGIKNSKIPELNLYPNPVTNYLNISSDIVVERLDIYRVDGALVKSVDTNIKSINMSNFDRGIYVVCLITKQGIYKHAIVKN